MSEADDLLRERAEEARSGFEVTGSSADLMLAGIALRLGRG